MFRIQKLLLSEYKDFEEAVLVESPFAQVNEFGFGIKQVQIALTATKLLIGNDTFDESKTSALTNILYDGQDPEIETMELISMLPLEFLYIKVYRKGSRQLMKVSVGTAKTMYFEFGGYILKNTYWNIWRERISVLRANQHQKNRFTYTEHSPNAKYKDIETVSTTTVDTIPESQQVVAVVHRANGNFSPDIVCKSPPKSPGNLMGSFKVLPKSQVIGKRIGRSDPAVLALERCDQEMVLREVAEYFLETQSDIVIGQHPFGYDSCDGSCRNFLFRSASVANLIDNWNTNYNGY